MTRILRRLVACRSWHVALATLLSVPLLGQTVQPIPTCGKPGDTICISGSGWAEPNPLCRYIFTMDGVSIAPDQQDGVYGPPATSGTVPSLPDGNHTILVQLVLDDASSTLVQQSTAPFSIASTQPNPWGASCSGTKCWPSPAKIETEFNPQNVCTVSPCTQLVFIQVYKQFAIMNNGTQVATKDSFWGLPAARDADFTANLFAVDAPVGLTNPYDNDGGMAGNNAAVGPPLPATAFDTPNQSSFPTGYKGILIEFETAIFCAAGDGMGKYYGRILWQFTQNSGQAVGTSTILSSDQNQPSADFLAAVNQWITDPAHPYTLPTPNPATCIYN